MQRSLVHVRVLAWPRSVPFTHALCGRPRSSPSQALATLVGLGDNRRREIYAEWLDLSSLGLPAGEARGVVHADALHWARHSWVVHLSRRRAGAD